MAIIYGLKVNLSVAMVAMTNHTGVSLLKAAEQHNDHSFGLSNITREECEADLPKNGSSGGNQVEFSIYFMKHLQLNETKSSSNSSSLFDDFPQAPIFVSLKSSFK
jgi:hypothetical protein